METINEERFLGSLTTEIRYSYDKNKDISLIMVKVDEEMDEIYNQIKTIKKDEVPYIDWCRYDNKPILAMIVPDLKKDKAEGLVAKINQTGLNAVSTTYESKNATKETNQLDAEKMIYDLVVDKLKL